jgi:cytochrome P450 family 4
MHSFTDNVIKRRRKEFETKGQRTEGSDDTGIKKRLALMDLLLDAKQDGKPLTDQEIHDEVDTFMFAGHDTTTVAISFILLSLAKNPEVQLKVFEEVDLLIGDSEEHLTIKTLNDLHYLEKVIKESLRLYPSAPYIARKLLEETTIGGHTLPKDCNVYLSPYLMGRDANLFPDPLKFNPERFDSEAANGKVNLFAYIPFSAGNLKVFD